MAVNSFIEGAIKPLLSVWRRPLALAGILSVIMSTADSYLIVSVQTCVHDIYKVFRPDIPEKKELRLTRVFAVILPLGALFIALYIKNAYNILMFAWSFYAAAAGLPAFAALYWKKATKAGILAGMGAGFSVTIVWKLLGQPFGLGATVPGAIACALALVGTGIYIAAETGGGALFLLAALALLFGTLPQLRLAKRMRKG